MQNKLGSGDDGEEMRHEIESMMQRAVKQMKNCQEEFHSFQATKVKVQEQQTKKA